MTVNSHGHRVFLGAFLTLVLLSVVPLAQQPAAPPPPPPPINESDDPLLKPFRWRSIGPASMGGRVDDIAVVESNPYIIYVGYATGGVWKTTNNGTTWTPIFDTYPVASIGDLAVSQSNPDIVWVGTGEPNNRQSSSFGNGIYKSTDAGKTFTNMGLKESQSIARIVIDPKLPDVAYVAAVGHLFGPNDERGIFKTTDGGKTWNKVKFIDGNTGFTDIAMDPRDSRTLYAASYQRRRTSWGMNGGGPGSGIWKTTDAGQTWTRLQGNGLPVGSLGRIGLDVSRSNPNVVYAQIEVNMGGGTGGGGEPGAGRGGQAAQTGQAAQPGQPQPAAAGQQAQQPQAAVGQQPQPGQQQQQTGPPDPKRHGVWRSDDRGKTWRIMSNNNNRPMYYSQIRIDPTNDKIIYTMGASFYKSVDAGKTFDTVGGIAHGDHHALWINPRDGRHLVIGNDGGVNISYDQAATWEYVNTMAVGQFYAIGVDMRKPYYVCGGLQDNGSWCGPSALRTQGPIINADWYRIGGGDGFYVQIDPTDFTTVYVESQDGNVQRLSLKTGQSGSIRPRARPAPGQGRGGRGGPPPSAPAAGRGGQPTPSEPEPQQPAVAQAGGGRGGQPQTSNILPEPPVGEQYRFNWSTPIHLSPHNPTTVYVGANKLFKSVNRGETWTAVSPDLTKQIDRNKLPIMGVAGDQPMHSKNDGTGNTSNITSLAESPVQSGVLWVGTNDGNVQVSRDGGATWTNTASKMTAVPEQMQVSRVEPSHFEAGTCYVSLDGHRTDDQKPYIAVTRDFGATWKSIVGNLPPEGQVNVIREDPKNRNLLYVGTEYGLFVSLDGGASWKKFMTGLPTVRIDDILVHPRDNDLIVATHGRSIWIVDDITPLQQWKGGPSRVETTTSSGQGNGDPRQAQQQQQQQQQQQPSQPQQPADIELFDIRPATLWLQDTALARNVGAAKHFRGENPGRGTFITYYLKSPAQGPVRISIHDVTGKLVRNLEGTKGVGINRVRWNLQGEPPPDEGGGRGGRGGGGQPAEAAAQPGQQPPQPPAQQAGGGRGGRGGGGGPPIEPGIYLVKLSVGGKELTKTVVVEADVFSPR